MGIHRQFYISKAVWSFFYRNYRRQFFENISNCTKTWFRTRWQRTLEVPSSSPTQKPMLSSMSLSWWEIDKYWGQLRNIEDKPRNIDEQSDDACHSQVGDKGKPKKKLFGVRAILGVRSRVFQEMLYGISTVFGSPQVRPAAKNWKNWENLKLVSKNTFPCA